MKRILLILLLMGLFLFDPAYAFIGEYNSTTGNDMALLLTFKSCEADYEDSSDVDFDVERKTLIFGVSKAILSKGKVYGGFNWGLDGEIDDTGYDLDHGYSLTAGGSYTFYDNFAYAISGFGQLDYIIEEEHEHVNSNATISLDGFETFFGVMGKYNFNPYLSAYGVVQLMLLSDLTADLNTYGDIDVERDDSLGFKFGVIYDQVVWFLKGEMGIGMDSGFALTGGMKF